MKLPFITFEGFEGTGKTTQSGLLAEAFAKSNISFIKTREPGGSEGAEAIRNLLVKGDVNRWDAKTEVLLHFSARRDHIKKIISPALNDNKFVICDRFVDSTIAYQHYGHGLDIGIIDFLSEHIVENILPSLTFIFYLADTEDGISRANQRKDNEDRYEKMGNDFHKRVADGFIKIAKENPNRCHLINANQTIEEINKQIILITNKHFNLAI